MEALNNIINESENKDSKKDKQNRDKLIQQIKDYELLNDKYKEKTKQEILDNFAKNEKVEKSEELWGSSEDLRRIDKKYEELKMIRHELDKERDKAEDLRRRNKEFSNKELEEINSKLEELKKSYEDIQEKINNESPIKYNHIEHAPLKEYQKETIKELWKIDCNRNKIIKSLNEGTRIDEDIKNRIKKEVTVKFFDYYNTKLLTLKMKAARYKKNKLREMKKEIDKMPEGKDKEEKKIQLEREEKDFSRQTNTKQINRVRKIQEANKGVKNLGNIGGKPILVGKDGDGGYVVFRGKTWCLGFYKEIGGIKDIGGKPVIIGRDKDYGNYDVHRGGATCGYSFDGILEIKNIGGKPFVVGILNSHYKVYRGKTHCGYWKEIGEIKESGGKPYFIGKGLNGFYYVGRGNEKKICAKEGIKEIGKIGGKPIFLGKTREGQYEVYRGKDQCGELYKEISGIKEKWGKPYFIGTKSGGSQDTIWGTICIASKKK